MNYDVKFTKLVQTEALEILKVFHHICEVENLKYIMDFGTLLGAVRHKGFIPWDDDLDVAMPREDYEKFLVVAGNYLPNNLKIQNNRTEKYYYTHFTKIRKVDSNLQERAFSNYRISRGVWIDIFPYDKTCINPTEELKKIKELNDALKYKNYIFPVIYRKDKKLKTFPKLLAKKTMLSIIQNAQKRERSIIIKEIQKRFDNHEIILRKYTLLDSNKLRVYSFPICLDKDYDKLGNSLTKEDFSDRELVLFEKHYFYAPKRYDEILKERYGNYTSYPPKSEQRNTHYWE